MKFIDTHAHLYLDEFVNDIEQILKRALNSGVEKILMPALDRKHYNAMMKLVSGFPDALLPMIGVHPGSIVEDFTNEIYFIEQKLEENSFCAIGETGIDLYWDTTFRTQQMEAFEAHLHLAIKHNLPVVIHQRKSFNEIFEILEKSEFRNIQGVFHCFAGDIDTAKRCIDSGFMLGIGGVVTYKNSQMAEVVRQIPLEYLVLETDAPYLPPVPFRGKRNEPSYIPLIAERIAEIKGCSIDKLASVTTANANQLFFN